MDARPNWTNELRRWRKAEGLSREQLARLAGISAETIKGYALGRRRPTGETLELLLDALRVERGKRADLLEAAGFAPHAEKLRPRPDTYGYSIEEAQREIDSYAWPSQVNNELMEVVALNHAAMALWSASEEEAGRPVHSNLMGVASHPAFGGRIRNWEQVVSIGVGIMKGHTRGHERDPESLSPYYAKVMQEFLSGDPQYVARLLRLWETVEPSSPKSRWATPVILDHPTAGDLRFTWVSSMCNEIDGLFFNDWVPMDGRTWAAIEDMKATRAR